MISRRNAIKNAFSSVAPFVRNRSRMGNGYLKQPESYDADDNSVVDW